MRARVGPLLLAAAAYFTAGDTCVFAAVGWAPWRAIVSVGIGWDEKLPLSPWPRLYDHPTRKGNRLRGFAWCGVFVEYSTAPE